MVKITVGVSIFFATFYFGIFLGYAAMGPLFAATLFLSMVGVALILEVWVHKYISKFGEFSLIEFAEPDPRIDVLMRENEALKLHIATIVRLLSEKDFVSAEELKEVVDVINAEDGHVVGNIT